MCDVTSTIQCVEDMIVGPCPHEAYDLIGYREIEKLKYKAQGVVRIIRKKEGRWDGDEMGPDSGPY